MADPIKTPRTAETIVNAANEGAALKSLHEIDSILADANKKKAPTEFVVLIRHPEKKTLHALLNPKAGLGALAVFQSPELASVQVSTVAALQNKEYYIIPVE